MSGALKGVLAVFGSLMLAGCLVCYWYPGPLLQSGLHALRWWAGLERYEVQVDDHRWVYLDGGGKGAPIVFIHGFGADKDRWGTILSALSRNYRVIAPDLPGFGENSRIPSAGYDIPTQAERLNRFLKSLGLEAFHLFGISMGGYIAGYYATEYPEKLKSLALVDAAGVRSRVQSRLMVDYERDRKMVLLYKNLQEFDELIEMLFYDPPWVPERIKAFMAQEGIDRREFREKILAEVAKGDAALLEGRLSKIKVPTLIVWGANDRILDVSSVEKLQAGIEDSRTVIIEQCGHVPYIEKPHEMEKAYREFLRDLS